MDGFYSAMVIDANTSDFRWRLFGYGLSQPVAGIKLLATRVHTNVPRPGYAGLPMGWDMIVRRWRAITSIRFAEPMLAWAAETSVELHYNNKSVRSSPLLDLLMAPQYFESGRPPGPSSPLSGTFEVSSDLWIRENLSFEVIVETTSAALTKLQCFLVENALEPKLTCWVYLEGLIRRAAV